MTPAAELLVVTLVALALGYVIGRLVTLGRALARIRELRDHVASLEEGYGRTVALGVMGEVLSELER